jgi:hypothetical protein
MRFFERILTLQGKANALLKRLRWPALQTEATALLMRLKLPAIQEEASIFLKRLPAPSALLDRTPITPLSSAQIVDSLSTTLNKITGFGIPRSYPQIKSQY